MDSYCRTCMCQLLGSTENIKESFNIFQVEDFLQKLMRCSNLKMEPNDGYPTSVCAKCFESVLSFDNFREMCHNSLDMFTKMLLETRLMDVKEGVNEAQIIITEAKDNFVDHEDIKYDFQNEPTACQIDPLLDNTDIASIELEQGASTNLDCINQRKERGRPRRANETTKADNSGINLKDVIIRKSIAKSMDKVENVIVNCDDDMLTKSSEDEGTTMDLNSFIPDNSKQTTNLISPRLQCDICFKKFRFEHRLDAHIRQHQGERGYPCTRENCNRTFNRLSYLHQHLNDHDGIARTVYKCEFTSCKQTYTCRSGLRAHRRKYHSGKPPKTDVHMCETCGAVLTSSRSLRDHRFIHIDKSEWPFICDVEGCAKRFRILNQLKIHQKRHAGIKNYPCPHCDMRFVTRTNMNNHINHHTWEKTWTCDFCPKVCNTPAVLRAHVQNKHGTRASLVSENEIHRTRNFQCSFCERAFLTADGKKYHELIHTGEKPHVCEECGKRFRQPAGLKTHMRTHKKDAPRGYVCGICGRAYFTSQTLRHHEMKHTGEKPYKCGECGLTFRWPNNLTRHQRLLHQKNNQTDNKRNINC